MRKATDKGWVRIGRVGMVLALAGFAGTAQTQDRDDPGDWGAETGETNLRLKQPRWLFGRPAKSAPGRQLRYAQNLLERGRLRSAQRQFRALVHEWHDAPEAVLAQQAYAETLERRRKHARAFKEYEYLHHYFPSQYSFREAFNAQFRLANHVMGSRTGQVLFFPGFDASERALPLFKSIVATAAFSTQAAEAWYNMGWIHETNRDYVKAAETYETLILRHPNSEHVPDALYRRASCLYSEAIRYPRDERGLWSAANALVAWIDYQNGGDRKALAAAEARLNEIRNILAEQHYERAAFYDVLAQRPSSALIAYGGFLDEHSDADQADKVRARMRELRKKTDSEPAR